MEGVLGGLIEPPQGLLGAPSSRERLGFVLCLSAWGLIQMPRVVAPG